MSSSDPPKYVQQNVAYWTQKNADYTDAAAERAWAQDEITWGVWETPESQLNVIGDVEWDDAIPGVRRFYASDPWGNRLEFVNRRVPGSATTS